jgi:uncharacterized protein YdeI (YjbR/CyaY-like superfamily)
MTPAGARVVQAAKADGSWSRLDDVEALIMPPDLDTALTADPTAAAGFAALPASQRKLALYWVASAKTPGTRTKRIAETVTAAAEKRSPR